MDYTSVVLCKIIPNQAPEEHDLLRPCQLLATLVLYKIKLSVRPVDSVEEIPNRILDYDQLYIREIYGNILI